MLSGAEDETEQERPRKRGHDPDGEKHRKRRKENTHSDDEGIRKKKFNQRRKDDAMDTSDDNPQRKKGGKKPRVDDESDDASPKGKKKKKSKLKSIVSPHSEPSSTSSSDIGSGDDEWCGRRTGKSSRKRSMSPIPPAGLSSETMDAFQGAHVYRAIRQERISLGWSQAPCGTCPVFDFCKQEGPVNPSECTYFEEWLGKGVIKFE
jgi:DNA-directed RNA polymerase III subunit RPC6